MQTIVLSALRQLTLVERPQPQLRQPHEVLLRIAAVGVCGSDVHYFRTGRIGSQVVQYPWAVGHECAATVVAVGGAVTHLQVGDRVAVDPAVSCGNCDQCRAGRPHTCRKLVFMGCPGQLDGCLSEYYVLPAECCFPVRASTSFATAALVEPLSVGLYAVRQSIPMPGATVGILGAGPIGLSVLAVAAHAGAATIYVSEPLAGRRALAAAHGATAAFDPTAGDLVAAVTAAVPGLLDVVFECCGQQAALDQAVRLLKPGGKLMLVGIPEIPRVSFDIDLLRRKELCLQNVRRQNHCMQPAIDLLESGALNLDYMITHHFPLARCQEAFELVDAYRDGVVKAIIST